MEITKTKTGTTLKMDVSGRLDTTTAPQLEAEIKDNLDGTENLYLNFENLEYISSAGLRVLLMAQKFMNKQGKMVINNVCEEILEVFDITGFKDILTIE